MARQVDHAPTLTVNIIIEAAWPSAQKALREDAVRFTVIMVRRLAKQRVTRLHSDKHSHSHEVVFFARFVFADLFQTSPQIGSIVSIQSISDRQNRTKSGLPPSTWLLIPSIQCAFTYLGGGFLNIIVGIVESCSQTHHTIHHPQQLNWLYMWCLDEWTAMLSL